MSDVTESTIPVENEAGEPLSKALLVLVKEQQADIIASGVEITKVVIREGGGPPRH